MTGQNRRTDTLAATLAGRILTGAWPQGHKLPADDALCAEFSVSRTVIREAFRLLTGKGLLTARPRVGTLVADKAQWSLLDADLLSWLAASGALPAYAGDIADIRLAVEPSLAALAAARADDAANQTLQTCLRALQETADRQHEMAFLTALYAASGNQMARTLTPLADAALKIRAAPPPLPAYAQLTAAIAQKDSVGARQAALHILLET